MDASHTSAQTGSQTQDQVQNRTLAYEKAGVSITAGNQLIGRIKSMVESTRIPGVISEIGGFGGLFRPDIAGFADPVLVASTDGVGTKLKLACAFGAHDNIGIDLVAMCVNDILTQGAMPLFFLDYFATGKLDTNIAERVISGIARGCRQANCALLGGETAEMPSMYAEGEYDLAGFCVGLIDNKKIIDGSSIKPGDAIIGLASSGIHANGYSLVREILAKSNLGGEDTFPETNLSVQEVLLAPTVIYVEPVRQLMRDIPIKGMVHITGGGFYDNIPRILPKRITAQINFSTWQIPPVFSWLKDTGGLSNEEMLQIFNCGIGYIIFIARELAEDVLSRLDVMNIQAWNIGEAVLRNADEEQVQIKTRG